MNVRTSMMEIPVPWPEMNWSWRPGGYEDDPGTIIGYLRIHVNHWNFAMQIPDDVVKELGPDGIHKILQEGVKQAHEAWGEAFKIACLSINLAYWRRRKETLDKIPGAFTASESREIISGLANAVDAMIGKPT